MVTKDEIIDLLENVKDPEIPVISIVEMGMITDVAIGNADYCEITMTPTFVGCPAIDVIKKDIESQVKHLGFKDVRVMVDLKTHWNSDRMSSEAKTKLEKFGLAPPPVVADEELTEELLNRVRCPHCGSTDTTLRSSFGSTLCRAIRFCFTCKQGFEQFKPVV